MSKAPRFTVYHINSTMEVKSFYFEHHARELTAKLNQKSPATYNYAGIEDYRTKVVYMVERTNMMSGEKYMEPSNTPGYLSPSSEAYWSM